MQDEQPLGRGDDAGHLPHRRLERCGLEGRIQVRVARERRHHAPMLRVRSVRMGLGKRPEVRSGALKFVRDLGGEPPGFHHRPLHFGLRFLRSLVGDENAPHHRRVIRSPPNQLRLRGRRGCRGRRRLVHHGREPVRILPRGRREVRAGDPCQRNTRGNDRKTEAGDLHDPLHTFGKASCARAHEQFSAENPDDSMPCRYPPLP